jgi:predicted nucleic acid-binding protein
MPGSAPLSNMAASRWAIWNMMIAAQAIAAHAVLVTHDRAFRRVKQLKIEDWSRG